MRMRRIVVATVLVVACAVLGTAQAGLSLGRLSLLGRRGGDPITICHRTDRETHPYVRVTVDAASTDVAGHELHTGTVWYPGHAKEPKWGDIIPPTDNDHDRSVHPR